MVSPHGHADPQWSGRNTHFTDAPELFVIPDHYVVRMLITQGVSFEMLGIDADAKDDRREIWQAFSQYYHLFKVRLHGFG
ncbi:hypothetical protein N9383_05205 [Granulosicoccus sp.]|nr:hypothetical protein [Granulosicoccus sp.]